MNEDRLLQELAERARRERGDDPDARWDALAAGQLDTQTRQRLIDDDPDGERRTQAYDPLSQAFREQIGSDIRASLATQPAAAPRGRPSRWLGAMAAGLMAAIALMLLLPRSDQPASLPAYSATLHGGASMRSNVAAGDLHRVEDGDRIELILTPATSVASPMKTRAFLAIAGQLTPVDLPAPQWSEFGAARVVVRVGEDLDLPPGDSVLVIAVARAGQLPGRREIEARLARPDGDDAGAWHLLRFSLRRTGP